MSKSSSLSSGRKGRGRQRSLVSVFLAVAMLAVLPAAIAWACVPSSSIGFDKAGYKYKAGETVTVTGRGFPQGQPVVMRLQAPSGEVSTVGTTGKTSDDTGAFTDKFALASGSAVGDYVVSVTVGTRGARETLTVFEEAAPPPPPVAGTPPVAPESAPAPATPRAETNPTEEPDAGNTGARTTAQRRKAIRSCRKKASSKMKKARSSSAKRKIAKRRGACVRKVRKRFA